MNTPVDFQKVIASARLLLRQAASLLLYAEVVRDAKAFLALVRTLAADAADELEILDAYGNWFCWLAEKNQSWQEYLIAEILQADNPFSRRAQSAALDELPPALVAAARQDLRSLQTLYECDGKQIGAWVQTRCHLTEPPISWQVDESQGAIASELASMADWGAALPLLASRYRQNGAGIFARYRAFCWQGGRLQGIAHPDLKDIDRLVGYEWQRDALLKNTEFLLAGYPALHVLLYGSRGSGKSSLVKGLLKRYGDRGLRLVEVPKSDLQDLPRILDWLRQAPQKFIIFVDDLSFEEDDDAFKALKVILEGNVTARPQNVAVYATSNRRHLIREFFGDRPRPSDGEVHAWDTMQEKLSFSDRFGLTLTFEPADQSTYLAMVRHLAQGAGIDLEVGELEARALQWATRHNGRSGRTAQQFIDFLQGELAIANGHS